MNPFKQIFYVQVRKNIFRIRNLALENEVFAPAAEPFTTERLLIGEFTVAEETLKIGLKLAGRKSLAQIQILIHPLEMTEGGLSQVEDRIFLEMALGTGASKVVVFVGDELTNEEVKEKFHAKK
jgi:hypothetical protein